MYPDQATRAELDPMESAVTPPSSGSDLSYVFTREINRFLEVRRIIGGRLSDEDYNTVIGALESCKLEFYRRKVALHEDLSIQSNGDVYSP